MAHHAPPANSAETPYHVPPYPEPHSCDPYLGRIFVDWVTVSVLVDQDTRNISSFQIEDLNDAAKAAGPNRPFLYGGHQYTLRYQRGAYVLYLDTEDGYRICLLPRYKGKQPAMQVMVRGIDCRLQSQSELYRKVQRLAYRLFDRVEDIGLSQVDLCVDTVARPVDLLAGDLAGPLVNHPHAMRYYVGNQAHQTLPAGVTGAGTYGLKKAGQLAKAYDKRLRETRRGSRWHAYWANLGLPEDVPLMRTEFSLRRERLKKLGIYTWSDLNADSIQSAWAWATQQYIRYEHDGEIHPLWQAVQAATPADLYAPAETPVEQVLSLTLSETAPVPPTCPVHELQPALPNVCVVRPHLIYQEDVVEGPPAVATTMLDPPAGKGLVDQSSNTWRTRLAVLLHGQPVDSLPEAAPSSDQPHSLATNANVGDCGWPLAAADRPHQVSDHSGRHPLVTQLPSKRLAQLSKPHRLNLGRLRTTKRDGPWRSHSELLPRGQVSLAAEAVEQILPSSMPP